MNLIFIDDEVNSLRTMVSIKSTFKKDVSMCAVMPKEIETVLKKILVMFFVCIE